MREHGGAGADVGEGGVGLGLGHGGEIRRDRGEYQAREHGDLVVALAVWRCQSLSPLRARKQTSETRSLDVS